MPKQKTSIKLRPNGSSGVKRGRLSRQDEKVIGKLIEQEKTVEEISIALKRPISQIETFVRKFHGVGTDLPAKAPQVAEFTRYLRQSVHWKNLQSNYTKEDLEYYEQLYSQIMNDFKDDISFVDEMQILQALDSQMLINEHKRHRKNLEDQIYAIEVKIGRLNSELIDNENDDDLKNKITTLESHKQELISRSAARVRQFTELSAKFDKTISALKLARDQRLKNADDANKSFTALIKHIQERKVREKEGKYAALAKFASEETSKKLQQPHKYYNGDIDQPILTPENILIDLPEVEYGNEIEAQD